MSIICTPRDYTQQLNNDIQNLLDDISDFKFTTPDGQVFNMSDINKKVPIYLDLKESRKEEHEITWQELCDKLDSLETEYLLLDSIPNNKCDKEDREKKNFLSDIIPIIQSIKNEHLNSHPNPSPNDIIPINNDIPLSGYYTRKGRSHKPEIVLLMETLGNNIQDTEDVAVTLVHEMFHAFYDYNLRKKSNYIPFVEEPLTEYAMLKFMEALAKYPNYYNLFVEAQRIVRNKQFPLGIAHYRFGYYLWKHENESGTTLDNIHWIDEFRKAKYSISDSTQEYKKYAIPFHKGSYVFVDEFHQMELLRVILLNANGSQLPLPQKNLLPHVIRWKKCGPLAFYAVLGNILCLDGVFLGQHSEFFSFDKFVNDGVQGINKIVLGKHFYCTDFSYLRPLFLFYNSRIELSSRNLSYVEINGAIYNAAKTVLWYCPMDASSLDIPNGVKVICSAFDHCSALQHVHIPASVEEIFDDGAFRTCVSLEDEIVFKQRLLCVPKTAINYTIPNGVKEIVKWAFDHCSALQHVHIPASVEEISDGAFRFCELLEDEIVFEQRLLCVPKTATEYVIPNEVKRISTGAFDHCSALQHVHIPASVEEISDGAFRTCVLLEDEIVFEQRLLCVPKTATEYVIPNKVKRIGIGAFNYCKVLKKVTIHGDVKKIPDDTFSDCENLKSVTINEGLEKIGISAFSGCRLTDVTLPASLKEIDTWAFSECPMQTLTFKGANPPKTDEPFETEYLRATCTIRVPAGSKDDYARIFPNHTIAEY